MRSGRVRIYDTNLQVWEEPGSPALGVFEDVFYREVFGPLIRRMRDRGWSVGSDPKMRGYYKQLSPKHRLADKGKLRASMEIMGRSIELKVWSVEWPLDHGSGRQFDYNKRQRMTHLTGLRCDAELKALQRFLVELHGYAAEDDFGERPGKRTPMQIIKAEYASCVHTDKALGHPRIEVYYGAKSAEGESLQQGQRAWVRGRDGRVRRGLAYYRLNSRWFFVSGGKLDYVDASELHVRQPEVLRRQFPEKSRRMAMEEKIANALAADQFERASKLRLSLFGDQPLYRVWSREHNAYWRPQAHGYTQSELRAGRYTFDEAFKLVANDERLEARPIGSAPKLEVERRAAA